MAPDPHPVRRCAPCDRDWPNIQAYNLCPRCQRCTFASTASERPDYPTAHKDAARYQAIRDFDAKADAEAEKARRDWEADMHLLLERTPTIPDPPGAKGLKPLTNAQDVTHWDSKHLPTEGEIAGWDGDNA